MIFVEVLDRRGRVQRRERLDRFPASIGRAYDNDVILDDRFVGQEHLAIAQQEEGLILEDRGSVNGTTLYGSKRRVDRLPLSPGTEVRVGHTRLRFCTPDQPVAPTTRTAGHGLASLFSSSWARLGVVVASIGTLLLTEVFATYKKIEASSLLETLAGYLFALLIWAGLWSLGTRVVSHEFRFLLHCVVASLAAVVFTLVGSGMEYLHFFTSGASVGPAEWVAFALLSLASIYAHLSVASTMIRTRRAAAAGLTVAILFSLLILLEVAERDSFSGQPEFASELKPVSARWVPAHSASEFFASTRSLEAELEELVGQEKDAE